MHFFRFSLTFICTALLITLSMLAMLLTFDRRIAVKMARTMWAPAVLWVCGVRLKIVGLDQIDIEKPYVFVANHLSALDIPVMFRAIPHNLHFVAKKEIKLMPFVGWYMWATGMIFIDRSNRAKAVESLNKAGTLIRNGKHVIMFPEGTRNKDGSVGVFKKGPFLLADQSGVEVVPVAITGTNKVIHSWGLFSSPFEVNVSIGTAMQKPDTMDVTQFSILMRTKIMDLMGSRESVISN